ncbi:MAG: cell division protein SepF, partial [Eubacteriales bacterium]|nr:cell division protein SepF [Eubacteriales bacterium]
MAKLLDKMMNLVGWEEEYEEPENEAEIEEEVVQDYKRGAGSKKNQNKVVNIHTTTNFKVVILNPQNFEQARDITDNLKNNKPVVVNVEGLEKNLAQRIVDFLSGSVYALNGNIQKVANCIFLIAPQNVDIQGGIKEDFDEKGSFSW